jgi:hypothetical protein
VNFNGTTVGLDAHALSIVEHAVDEQIRRGERHGCDTATVVDRTALPGATGLRGRFDRRRIGQPGGMTRRVGSSGEVVRFGDMR